jgi:homoserine dehydrogenase
LEGLRALDADFANRLREAKAQDKVLRYVARIDLEHVTVGLEPVLAASPLGRLRGTDNTIVFYTKRYAQNPLVVTGPGAGADVTAAGVLNDIVAISSPGRFTGPTR